MDDVEVGEPLVVGNRVIRPLARRAVWPHEAERAAGVVGVLEPVGVLVEGPEGVRALDLDGDEIEFEVTYGPPTEDG